MSDINLDRSDLTKDKGITETFSIIVQPQANGQYFCQLSSAWNDSPIASIQCHGQTKEHAIAIALENLASKYRRMAEASQKIDSLAIERTESGDAIDKHYHVMLHYECIIEDESKFSASHNAIMGNTVVENAEITLVEIAPELQIEGVQRLINDD
jgi:hypothetical protein